MADKKISELTSIVGADTAADDFFVVVDTSGSATKKISRAELNNAIEQDVLAQVDITSANIDGGTIDNTPIGSTTASTANFTTVETTGNVTVGGNLTVNGTTTTVNSTTLDVDDINITVASGAASAAAADGAGLTVDGASATFNYASTGDKWTMNKPLDVTGTVTMTGATTTGDINFGDNDKAIFGAGSYLQIYYDSATGKSVINEVGSGSLQLQGTNIQLKNADNSKNYIAMSDGGDVDLYYDNAIKLSTTSSGIDVTGTVTADGLTVDATSVNLTDTTSAGNSVNINGYGNAGATLSSQLLFKNYNGVPANFSMASIEAVTGSNRNNGGLVFSTYDGSLLDRLKIDYNGDVSLYDSTGVTQGFYWDASTQRLGLGTTSPSSYGRLAVMTPTANYGFFGVDNSVGGGGGINLAAYYGTTKISYIDTTLEDGTPASEDTRITFATINNGTLAEKVRISSDGFISLVGDTDTGWSFPASNQQRWTCGGAETFKTYQIAGAYGVLSVNGSGSATYPNFTFNGDDNTGMYRATTDTLAFTTGGSEAMRILSNSDIAFGNTSANLVSNTSTQGGGGYVASDSHFEFATNSNRSAVEIGKNNANDGILVTFRKQGNSVGAIGATNSRLFIGDRIAGLRFVGDLGWITPWNAGTNSISDGVIDLGASNARFSDAYFSGEVQAQFFTGNGDTDTYIDISSNPANTIKFYTGGSERARVDASGNLLVGKTTTVGAFNTVGIELRATGLVQSTVDSAKPLDLNRKTTTGEIIGFNYNGTAEGSVTITASGVTYNTTSDLRLKENIEPLVATDKLMAMNPVSYNWKADPDGPRSMGFIAQEMQQVMPEAVSAGDDEDAMMSMDYGRITPILVSALQDAHRKIEELETRIAALEAK